MKRWIRIAHERRSCLRGATGYILEEPEEEYQEIIKRCPSMKNTSVIVLCPPITSTQLNPIGTTLQLRIKNTALEDLVRVPILIK